MEKVIAVFDLEGTLFVRSNYFLSEIRNVRVRGITQAVISYISLFVIFICFKIHIINELTMRTMTFKRMVALIKDSKDKDIAEKAIVFASRYKNLLRPEMSLALKERKTKGHITILFSGMLQPYLKAIKQELGIDIAKGTELEIKDGCYTGRIDAAPYFGERRAQALGELIDKLDYKINLSASFAYGDAMLDNFFMGMVGNPVAVYPDKKLEKYARQHGWRINQ